MLTKKERAKLVGERIVQARRRAGMSQLDLAARLAERFDKDRESVRRSLVNNETGRYAPRFHTLEAIADATSQPLDFFAVGDGDEEPFRAAAV